MVLMSRHRAVAEGDDSDEEMTPRLPSFGSTETPVLPETDSTAVTLSEAALQSGALERRRWLMMYRDPEVEAEFVTFSNRSPWPFPFMVFLSVANLALLYVNPLRDWGVLPACACWVLLVPAAVILSSTCQRLRPAGLTVSARSRAAFIEHAVMPVFALAVIFLIYASVRRPLRFAFHIASSFSDAFDIFRKDVNPATGRDSYPIVLLDLHLIMLMPMCTLPRFTTAFPSLLIACVAGCVIVYTATTPQDDDERWICIVELIVKTMASLILLGGWEWDRRRHFEVCVRTFRQSRQINFLVARLYRHIRTALPLGCALPSNHSVDPRYSADGAVIIALRLAVSPARILVETPIMAAARDMTRRLTLIRCLADVCDRRGAPLGVSRFAAMGDEVLMATGLFDPRAPATSFTNSPGVRACAFAAEIHRAFRVECRAAFPEDESDSPAVSIGVDTGAVIATVPYASCEALTAIVSGRPVRGAEMLAGVALPGSVLVSGAVHDAIREHYSVTELHCVQLAGRTTRVCLLGQPLSSESDEPTTSLRSLESDPSATPSFAATRSDRSVFVLRSGRERLDTLLQTRSTVHVARMTGNMFTTESFEDPDVEKDYLMHETNSSLTRYVGPGTGLLCCVFVIAAYFSNGDGLQAAEWICVTMAACVSALTLAVVHRGRMAQCTQIAVRWSLLFGVVPLLFLTTFFHETFFDMVRFRMHVILTPVGVALMGIVPSRMPVTLDAVLRIVSFRFCTAVFVGITPSAGLVSFAITDFAVQVTSLLVFRSRNRWAYVDYAIAKHAKVTWTATRLAIEEMLAHLLPKEVAQQITQFKPDEVTASHATVVCLSVWCADDENPETHAADVTMVEECNPACSHDVHIRTILQTMPSVASGAVHVQQHGSRWLLFGNLGDEFDCVDTDELREEVAEAALRITVAIKTTRITVHQFEGMLSGAVVGHVAARMFVAVGPALDEALLAARGSTPGDADDAK
jgi:class 3 adenylate cyclase